MMAFLSRYLARAILFLLGWRPLSARDAQIARNTPRAIAIFPHTSYFDFCFFALYSLAYPDLLGAIYTVCSPNLSQRWGWLLRHFNCIIGTRLEDRNTGFVGRTVQQFAGSVKARILISPEGRLARSEWRSGYYYLARELSARDGREWPIVVVGVDYEVHQIKVAGTISSTLLKEQVEVQAQALMAQIVSLYPERSWTPCYPQSTPRIYDPITVTHLLKLWCTGYVWEYNWLLCLMGLVAWLGYLLPCQYSDIRSIKCIYTVFCYLLYLFTLLMNGTLYQKRSFPYFLLTVVITYLWYFAWQTHGDSLKKRSTGYIWSQSIYNLLLPLWLAYPHL